jgi:hypothetical protein
MLICPETNVLLPERKRKQVVPAQIRGFAIARAATRHFVPSYFETCRKRRDTPRKAAAMHSRRSRSRSEECNIEEKGIFEVFGPRGDTQDVGYWPWSIRHISGCENGDSADFAAASSLDCRFCKQSGIGDLEAQPISGERGPRNLV